MEIIEQIKIILEQIIRDYGLWGILFNVWSEAFIQPIPVDPLIFASASFLDVKMVMFVVLIGTILGSATGYFLGKYLGEPIFIKIFGKTAFTKGHAFMEKWGVLGVIIAGLTPIPYKVITWSAGIFEMNFWVFIGAGIIGRMPRFILMFYFGEWFANIL